MNLLIYLVVGYVMYRLLIVRIKWRLVRFGLYVPILVGVALSIMTASALNSAQADSAEAVQAQIVDTSRSEQGDLVVSISASGAIQALRQVPLRFAFSSNVKTVNVAEGERVGAGQVIAELDTTDLEQTIQEARSAVEAQEAVFRQLTSAPRPEDVAAAQAALAAARAQYNAATATGSTAQQEEIARLQAELARNRNWQLQLQRDQATGANVTGFNLNLDENQQAQLNDLINQVGDANETAGVVIAGAVDALAQAQAEQEAQLRMQIEQLNAGLQQAEYGIQIADAQYAATVNRGADLGALAGAQAAIVQAETALEQLLNGADEIQLNKTQLDLASARLALQLAEESLTQARIVAPFAGRLAQNRLKVGELPPAQEIAVLLVDDSAFVVDLPIDETDIVSVQVGQRVRLTIDALPEEQVTGVVTRIAYTPLRVGQLVTYTTRIQLDATDAPLRVGMSVTAEIIVKERPDVVLVRNRFIRIDRITGDAFVTLQTAEGRLEERMILLGERNDVYSEVLSGLSADETLVLIRQTQTDGGLFN